jgi:hypothetical protein
LFGHTKNIATTVKINKAHISHLVIQSMVIYIPDLQFIGAPDILNAKYFGFTKYAK